jgi:hypothetical protein
MEIDNLIKLLKKNNSEGDNKKEKNNKVIFNNDYNNKILKLANEKEIIITNNEKINIIFGNDKNQILICKDLPNLKHIYNFYNLSKIKITNCHSLETIKSCPLLSLYINHCKKLKYLPYFDLESLKIFNMKNLDISQISTKLKYLQLKNTKIKIDLSIFINLECLLINNCQNIQYDKLKKLENLKELYIIENNDLKEIDNDKIEFAFLKKCKNLYNVKLNSLCISVVSHCNSLISLSSKTNIINKCYWLKLSNKKLRSIILIQKIIRYNQRKKIFLRKCLETKSLIIEPKIFPIIFGYF